MPLFSEHRTLDVAAWKKLGMRIQHYYNYGLESVPEDMPYFWMLTQERLNLNPDQQEVLPSAPPEELLDALPEPSSCNQRLMIYTMKGSLHLPH